MLWPQHSFMVKGWSRSIAAWTILRAAFECREFFEAGLECVPQNSNRSAALECEALSDDVKLILDTQGDNHDCSAH